jgi:hypothetical protein
LAVWKQRIGILILCLILNPDPDSLLDFGGLEAENQLAVWKQRRESVGGLEAEIFRILILSSSRESGS